MKTLWRASLIHAACLAVIGSASAAGSDSATMNVKIVITATADIHTVAPTDVDFGTVASTATNVASSGGQLTVNTTNGTPYNLGLGNGLNYSGTRRMTDGTHFVAYGLYSDAVFATPWGTTVGAGTVSSTGIGSNQTFQVYGRVPSANAPAGNYFDTVVVTVTY